MDAAARFPREDVERYLIGFDRGELLEITPQLGSAELSTCLLRCERGGETTSYLLTRFEALSFDQAPLPIRLMRHLHASGIPVPEPVGTLDGMTLTILGGVPAMLARDPGGVRIERPNPAQCAALGGTLADLHAAASASGVTPAETRDDQRHAAALNEVKELLEADEVRMIEEVLTDALPLPDAANRTGVVHGSPLLAYTRFQGDELVALIGFHRTALDRPLYDLAIAVVDWCSGPDGTVDGELARGMTAAYCERGPSSRGPQGTGEVWPRLLRLAAIELWLDVLKETPDKARVSAPRFRRRLALLSEDPVPLG